MTSNFSFHRQPSSLATSDVSGRFFPAAGGPEADLLAYRDRIINPWSAYWNYHMARVGLSMSYFLGRQWASLDYDSVYEGVRGVAIRQATDDDALVRPVTNELDPAVEQEVIALVKRKWTPKVTPTSDDPRIKAAAQVSNDQLNFRLEQIAWREKRHRTGLIFATGGISHIFTSWDKSYYDLRPEGSPDAVYCPNPGCQTKLFSPDVPVDTLRQGMPQPGGGFLSVQHLDTAKPVEPDLNDFASTGDDMATLKYCPTCPQPTPLRPVSEMPGGGMTDDDVESGSDVFGRPLGVDVPRGQTSLEIDLPWERFPQNGGALCEPDTVQVYGRRKIRSQEWLEERYPHLVGDIDPDNISEILYTDPLLGGGGLFSNYSPSLDVGILDYHNSVDELVRLPCFRHPLGRYAVCTKDKVLEDGPLLEKAFVEDVDGEKQVVYVPRVQDAAARYKLRPNEYWGTTIADNEISKQNRLNGMDAQIIETRLRMGPNILMPSDMWPTEGVDAQPLAGVGNVIQINPSISNPQARPEIVQGTLMPTDIYMERDRVQADIRRGIGPSEAAVGQPVKNVGTTSGLQLMVDQDEKSRSLREDELVNSAERAWTHLQRLEWALRVDPDVYRVLGPNKTWKYSEYRGNFFRGQYEVKIERSSFIGKSVMRREAARELLADKLVNPADPVTRRKLVEAYGFEDIELNQDTTNQVDHAERVWVDFVDKDIVRVQDMIDDPALHYVILSTHLRSDEGEQLADAAEWDATQRLIAGWEDKLRVLTEKEAQSIAFYGERLVGKAAAEAYASATVAYDEQKGVYAQQLEIFKQHQAAQGERDTAAAGAAAGAPPGPDGAPAPVAPSAAPPPVAPIPPTPPPPPIIAPVLMQDRVYTIWMGMIQEQQGQPTPGATTETQPSVVPPPSPDQPPQLPQPAPGDVDGTLVPQKPDKKEVYNKFRALVTSYKLAASMAMAPPPGPGGPGGPAPGPQPGPGPAAPPALGSPPEGGPH